MRRITVMIAAVCLIAAACSTDPDTAETTTTTSGAGGTTTTVGTQSAAESTTTTTAAPTTTTTTAPAAAASLDACVVGTWEMDSEAFFEMILASGDMGDVPGEIAYIDGEYLLIIDDDGAFEARRVDWSFGVTSDDGDIQLIINSSDLGTWSLDGDLLSTAVTADADPDIVILFDGEPVDLPAGVMPLEPPQVEFTGARVTCDGGTMTATYDGTTSTWTRQG